MTESPTTTPESTNEIESAYVLTSLKLVELLAQDCEVDLDRARVRLLLSEGLSEQEPGVEAHIHTFRQVLTTLGLQGRIRQLRIMEALAACQAGAHLVVALPGETPDGAWLYLRSAGLDKVQLATGPFTNDWVAAPDLERLLEIGDLGESMGWLLVEQSLPCALEPTSPGQRSHAAESDAVHVDYATHPSPLRRLAGLLRPEAKDIWIVSIFSAIVSLLALATPVTVEALVNTVAFGRFMQPVVVLSIVLLGFLGFAAAIRVLQTYIAEVIQRRLFVRVVADLSQRLPRVRQDAYEGKHGPELLNRFFDVMTVQKSAALLVLDGISIVLQTSVGMAVLAFYHPLLFGFDLLLLGALAFTIFVLGRGAVVTSIEESKAKYEVAAWLEQLASCPLTFKNAGGSERAVEQADKLAIDYLLARGRHFSVLMRQIAFTLGLQALAGSVLLGTGGWLVIQGKLTLGQLVAAELIVALIVGSFTKLGKHLESYYDLLAAVDKLGHLFDLPVERQQGETLRSSSEPLPILLGDHEIAAGELVAMTGPSGASKSRLLDAAFGLSSANDTPARVAGRIVDFVGLSSLRTQVALVRNCEVFAGSLADNVHLGRPNSTRAAVREVLDEVGLGVDMRRLPAGLDTHLLPGGSPLNNGQACRVVLARVLLGRPRLLLIDGLLDVLSDDVLPVVMETLERHTAHATIVIATGRNEIASSCHRVIAVTPAESLCPVSIEANRAEDSLVH